MANYGKNLKPYSIARNYKKGLLRQNSRKYNGICLEATKVVVAVIAESGDVIESGEAVIRKIWPKGWYYYVTTGNPDFGGSTIKVAVYDLHGNVEWGVQTLIYL
jgi:hypothetical protein